MYIHLQVTSTHSKANLLGFSLAELDVTVNLRDVRYRDGFPWVVAGDGEGRQLALEPFSSPASAVLVLPVPVRGRWRQRHGVRIR